MSDRSEKAPTPDSEAGPKANSNESSCGTPPKTSVNPNFDAAFAFLLKWNPAGPWVLTAIAVDRKGIETRTFRPAQEDDLRGWLEYHNAQGRCNIYFHVNPVLHDLSKKALRKDIASMAWLHVDIDPRLADPPPDDLSEEGKLQHVQNHIASEQKRILALLESPPGDIPPPTAVIFSGGGYQGFWKLEEPFTINGQQALFEEAKRYNLQLELLFGADPCHNVDRIMRLPGTVNWPDAKKRAKGRTPALARLMSWDDSRVYPLGDFAAAPLVQARSEPGFISATTIEVNGNIERLSGVDDERLAKVSDLAKVVIVQGNNPEDLTQFCKEGDGELDRSKALFYVCCEMVRGDCDDDTVYAVITDPDYGISASVLEKGNPRRYALRQIEQARAEVNADSVSMINLDYFAVLEGAKVTFYREEANATVTAMNKEAFLFELGHLREVVDLGDGKTKEAEAVRIWLKHPRRRYYPHGFVLDPTCTHGDGQYNLWRGFGIAPASGDWALMRRHIFEVLATGNAKYSDYIVRWAAWTVQNPATPARVALVFRGDEGVGKGVFCNALVRLFGSHGLRVQNMNQVAGRFNAHLRHCCLLFGDEAILPNDEHEGTFKGMITEPTLPIEAKGRDIVHADNHLHIVMASNNQWVVPAGIGARRFAMFDVADTYKGNVGYFSALFTQLEQGGLAAMLHDLCAMELNGWHPEAHRPDTAALDDQKMRSLPALDRYWLECLVTGTLPNGRYVGADSVFVPTVPFIKCIETRMRRDDITANAVQSLLGGAFSFTKQDRSRPRGWEVPPLPKAREAWDTGRFPLPWDDADEWQISSADSVLDSIHTPF